MDELGNSIANLKTDIGKLTKPLEEMVAEFKTASDHQRKTVDSLNAMTASMKSVAHFSYKTAEAIEAQNLQNNTLLQHLKNVNTATKQVTQQQTQSIQTSQQATAATVVLTDAQKELNITYDKMKKKFMRNGVQVNKFGQAVNNTGEVVNNFNKRTALMQNLAREMNKAGEKNIGFMKGYATYTKLGGNAAEYLAEFLTSSREELTIFGMEAAKARKVMYGFMPPGTFRMLNKFSSVLQFTGGAYRKMGDSGKNARNEIKELKKALKAAELAGEAEEVEAYTETIKELEQSLNPNMLTSFFGTFMKLAKVPMSFEGFMGMTRDEDRQQKAKDVGISGYEDKDPMGGRFSPKGKIKGIMQFMEKRQQTMEKGKKLEAAFLAAKKDPSGKAMFEGKSLSVDQLQEFGEENSEELQDIMFNMFSNHPVFAFFFKILKFIKIVGQVVLGILRFFFKAYFVFFVVVLGIIVIIKTIGPAIKEAVMLTLSGLEIAKDVFLESFNYVAEGFMDIFNAVFGDGSLDDAVMGLIKMAGGLLGMAISFGIILVQGAVSLVLTLGYAILKRGVEFFMGAASIGKKIAVFLGIALFFIATFWLQMSLLPAVFAAVVGYYIVKGLGKVFGFWATGGVVDKPLQVVGERGPEIAAMPKGTRVYNNTDTKKMLKSGGNVNNINVTINAKDTSDKEMRRIAAQIGKMINREVNRGTSSSYS